MLLGLAAAAEDDLAARPSHHDAEEGHDHDDFETFIVRLKPAADAASLSEKLANVARDHDVLRMKGFVEVAGKPMRLLVQGVGARFSHQFDRPWQAGEIMRARADAHCTSSRMGLPATSTKPFIRNTSWSRAARWRVFPKDSAVRPAGTMKLDRGRAPLPAS